MYSATTKTELEEILEFTNISRLISLGIIVDPFLISNKGLSFNDENLSASTSYRAFSAMTTQGNVNLGYRLRFESIHEMDKVFLQLFTLKSIIKNL